MGPYLDRAGDRGESSKTQLSSSKKAPRTKIQAPLPSSPVGGAPLDRRGATEAVSANTSFQDGPDGNRKLGASPLGLSCGRAARAPAGKDQFHTPQFTPSSTAPPFGANFIHNLPCRSRKRGRNRTSMGSTLLLSFFREAYFTGTSGDKLSPGYGTDLYDAWIVAFDPQGRRKWNLTLGGNGLEESAGMVATRDGRLLAVGSSRSPAGPGKTAPLLGFRDLWVVALAADATRLWDRTHHHQKEARTASPAVAEAPLSSSARSFPLVSRKVYSWATRAPAERRSTRPGVNAYSTPTNTTPDS